MSVAPELPADPPPVVLLRVVECAPPPSGPAEPAGWRCGLLDGLPALVPAPMPVRAVPVRARARRSAVAPITDAEARALATTTARAVLEVLEGRRPVAQLTPMLTERAVSSVHTMLRGGLRWPVRHATVGSVHVALPSHDAVEACVVFHSAHRHRALAMRIARERRRWVTTAIRVG